MYALDGNAGTLDPAMDAHVLPMKHWALLWWEVWVRETSLGQASTQKNNTQDSSTQAWSTVRWPTDALDVTMRAGWKWVSACTAEDHTGHTWNFTSARRAQWRTP